MAKAVKFNREPKVWVCIDDGTQKNFFFANNHGEKSRREPDSFEYETLDNGERKFYFKGEFHTVTAVNEVMFLNDLMI